jgi:phosphoglycerate dehydrogenase-like enzyme
VTYDPAQPPLPPGVVFVPFDELFTRSDIVSVHVPYDASTRNLIGARELGLMKPGAYLINTSRGEVLDEQALLQALETRHLAGAALDVLCGEYSGQPDWMQYDLLIRYARTHPNLLITPHIGGATYDSMHKTECFLAQKIRAYVQAAK